MVSMYGVFIWLLCLESSNVCVKIRYVLSGCESSSGVCVRSLYVVSVYGIVMRLLSVEPVCGV